MRRGPGRHGDEQEKADNPLETIHRLWEYMSHQRLQVILVAAFVVISTLGNLMGPFFMGRAIDLYIIEGDIPGLARMVGLMLAVYVVSAFFRWLQQYIMVGVSQRTLRNLRNDLFEKLQSLSLRFFDQRTHGELMSRVTNDIENINVIMTQSVLQFIDSVLTIIGILAVMLILNVRLTLIALFTLPIIFLITRVFTRYTRKHFADRQQNLADLNSSIEENITALKVVKIYCQEESTKKEFNRKNERFRESATKARIYANVLAPVMNLMNNFNFAVIAGIGGWLTIIGMATVGTVAAFLDYIRRFNRPIRSMAGLYNNIQSALAGAERVFEVIDTEPEIVDRPGAVSVDQIRGEVEFVDVTFGYEEDEPVLKDVSFRASPGQMVALVGPTGAGKTTIINLLTRFYDIDRGKIIIDGGEITDYRVKDLRSRIGVVLQDTYLFSDTVKENIRYGNLEASDEEVREAARLAYARHFIERLPDRYETRLTEEAANLSQGQRQLISIARTILADPDILILDEATSSIDTRTEKQIQRAMKNLMQDRTSFVIAHRLSTIENADKILVIREGRIIERGSHEQLLQKHGFYHDLYHSQFQDADAV